MEYNKDLGENDIELYVAFKKKEDGTFDWHICSNSQTKFDEKEYPLDLMLMFGVQLGKVVDEYNEKKRNGETFLK